MKLLILAALMLSFFWLVIKTIKSTFNWTFNVLLLIRTSIQGFWCESIVFENKEMEMLLSQMRSFIMNACTCYFGGIVNILLAIYFFFVTDSFWIFHPKSQYNKVIWQDKSSSGENLSHPFEPFLFTKPRGIFAVHQNTLFVALTKNNWSPQFFSIRLFN